MRFNVGTQALLVPNAEAVEVVFRGESAGDLTSFSGTVAAYARDIFYISDGSQTLAYNLRDKIWLDVGVGMDAMFYSQEADIFAVTIASNVLDFEDEGTTDDNGGTIPFKVEPTHIRLHEQGTSLLDPATETVKDTLVRRIHVDALANDETLAVTLILDGTEISLGNLTTGSSRGVTTFNVNRMGRVAGVRVSGDIDAIVAVYGIDIEIPDRKAV